jgi:basic membrane protein A and related proteins
VWTGDLNDPAKAQQFTSQLIAGGNDVILGSLNLGMVGAFQAAKSGGDGVLMSAKYTDKSSLAPENYLTSVLYDFSVMLDEILTQVADGTTGGYLGMDYDQGISVQPPANVDQAVTDRVNKAVEDIKSGAVAVERDVTPVQ